MTRLYVGNLPYSTNEQNLQDMFSAHGAVTSAVIISDRYSGRSKGFGFVEMENDGEAQNAINALNETEIEGRKIVVSVARPREERPAGGNGGFNRGGGDRRDFRRNDRRA